jgi:hypothetical protein
MTPGELYQAGKLTEAVTQGLEEVKKHPTDTTSVAACCANCSACPATWNGPISSSIRLSQQDPQSMVVSACGGN